MGELGHRAAFAKEECALTEEVEEKLALLPLSAEQVKAWNSGLGGWERDLTKGT